MINSVAKAFRLLELLDEADDAGLPLGEVARRAGLKSPTTHNLLATLVELGLAAQDPDTRNYALGARAGALGRERHTAGLLAAAARPVLEDLGHRLGETVMLTLCRARRRHTLVAVESEQALRVVAPSTVDAAFYASATGRMLLALLPAADLRAVVDEIGPPDAEWPEARPSGALRRRLDVIRSEGAVVLHRTAAHTIALAVPLAPPGAAPAAALGCYYPAARSHAGREEAVLSAMRDAAEAVALHFEAACAPPPRRESGTRTP